MSAARLVIALLVTVLLGTPLAAYTWETLNALLSGIVDPLRLALTVPAVVLLAALLVGWARWIERMDARRERSHPHQPEGR